MKNANTHDHAGGCPRPAFITALAVAGLLAGSAIAEPVQWSIEDGGNGHWYELLTLDDPVSAEEHFQIAESMGAHSATMATAEENTFCFGLSNNLSVIIGVRKEQGTNQGAWITGEPWNYTNWHGGEGNNSWERYVNFWAQDGNPSSQWQDTDLTPHASSMLEWDADCNGDGIVDYGQILDGTYEDADGNGVPDCCDQGEPCDVTSTNHVLELTGWPDAAIIPHHESITPLHAMTIEFWIRNNGSNGDGRPITKRPGNGGCYTINSNQGADGCVAGANVYGSCNSAHWGEIPCEWVHLALTVDGATGIARAYRNGDLVAEHDQGGPCTIGQGTWELRFGNTNGYSSTQFIGCLDNVRIWNSPLDEQEIRYWMNHDINSELASTLADLGGSWNFEDGVTDATGVNDGWLDGGASIVEGDVIIEGAVEWRTEDGGNGHWYEGLPCEGGCTSEEAVAAAEAVGGHLATLSTAPEDEWVRNTIAGDASLWGGTGGVIEGPWIGAVNLGDEWTWVDGSAWSYENWWPGNPGECCPADVSLWEYNNGRLWQDHAYGEVEMISFIVEWSADCNMDGIVDYGQILNGDLPDSDYDGIPDVCQCSADLDGDQMVGVSDLLVVIAQWGTSNPLGDVNEDGTVNIDDLLLVLMGWGECP